MPRPSPREVQSDLDGIFADPVLTRALMAVRVESLRDGRLVYALNDDKHVMPASNMKIVTLAAAAERLGWEFKYETRLEAAGPVVDGTLEGDLVVVGGGDPSIASLDGGPAPLFGEWANDLSPRGHPSRARAPHRRRRLLRRQRAGRRMGMGLSRGRLRRAVGRAQLQRESSHAAHPRRRGKRASPPRLTWRPPGISFSS